MMSTNGNGSGPAPANLLTLPPDPGAPQQLPAVRLDIYTEAVFRTIYSQEGQPVAYDEVSPLDLALAFADVDPAFDLLPENVLFCRRRQVYYVAVYLPPAVRTLEVDGGGKFTVPLPPLVFAGKGAAYYIVYALGQPGWPTAETSLYHAPFPNVSLETGKICHGSAEFPPCSPETIHLAAEAFFTSKFNHDLANGKSKANPASVIPQWRALAGAETYPAGDLRPANKLLGELWL